MVGHAGILLWLMLEIKFCLFRERTHGVHGSHCALVIVSILFFGDGHSRRDVVESDCSRIVS